MVAVLATDPAIAPSSTQGPEFIVAIAGATVVSPGVLQIVLGAVGARQFAAIRALPVRRRIHVRRVGADHHRAGRAARRCFTRADLAAGPASAWQALQPATLFVGLATAASIWAIGVEGETPAGAACSGSSRERCSIT